MARSTSDGPTMGLSILGRSLAWLGLGVGQNARLEWIACVTSWPGANHLLSSLHHCSTILSALGPDHALTSNFSVGHNSRVTSRWVTHPGSALASFSLNFGVPMKPETSEFPKGLDDIVRFGPGPHLHGFVSGNSQATSQWVTHHKSALATFSLNFEVPTEPEANELPKGIVLGRDENIHLRITPLGDVECYSLGAWLVFWLGVGLSVLRWNYSK
ncbi:hypothetical protein DVH24_034554 [Malus domestica]|uniref:Uncharacterized protein n=1 Tax=Malus domestica TaxID=3750 RepID=A0A498IZX1_MALDO|nr:hypothetical protein DVH24_034554 [Malus domestica]